MRLGDRRTLPLATYGLREGDSELPLLAAFQLCTRYIQSLQQLRGLYSGGMGMALEAFRMATSAA